MKARGGVTAKVSVTARVWVTASVGFSPRLEQFVYYTDKYLPSEIIYCEIRKVMSSLYFGL